VAVVVDMVGETLGIDIHAHLLARCSQRAWIKGAAWAWHSGRAAEGSLVHGDFGNMFGAHLAQEKLAVLAHAPLIMVKLARVAAFVDLEMAGGLLALRFGRLCVMVDQVGQVSLRAGRDARQVYLKAHAVGSLK